MADTKMPKILIVDDDQDLREVIAIDFENLGYMTATAKDGAAALSMIEKENFDIVVTDLRMPTLSGLGLYKKIVEMNLSQTPVTIFITGFSDVNIIDAFDLGVSDYIEKPFSRRNLITSVQWHLIPSASRWCEAPQSPQQKQEPQGALKRIFDNFAKAEQSGLLKLGRGGFLLTLNSNENIPTTGLVLKFEIGFSDPGETPWIGQGRIRWVEVNSTPTVGVEILNLDNDSLKAFLKLQNEHRPRSYIPKS